LINQNSTRYGRFFSILQWLIPVGILVAWEILVRTGRLSTLFFPAPTVIVSSAIEMIRSGELQDHLGATLVRMLVGLSLGGLPGLIVGVALGTSRGLRKVVDPIIAALHPIPKISILPLFMIFFGIGELSKVVVIAVAAFFPMMINSMAAVRQINPTFFEVASSYGASTRMIYRRVVIPASLPVVMVGLRLAVNAALLITVAIEIINAREGLGALIWFGWQTLRTADLYVSLSVIAVLGLVLNFALQQLTRFLVPWQTESPG
jgi:NitT/TauT family transport system permease protein